MLQQAQPAQAIIDAMFSPSRGDCYIAIGSRRPTKKDPTPSPHFLTPLATESYQTKLPMVFEYGNHFNETLYLCPQTFDKRSTRKSRRTHDGETIDTTLTPEEHLDCALMGRPQYFRVQNRYVRELGAVVCDLDVGRPGEITAAQAIGLVVTYSLEGKIPLPSFAAYSGTGAYLFYLLIDDDGFLPQATPDNRAVWGMCGDRLRKLTEHLKSDPNAARLCNWYKMPDTLDTKTGNRVIYLTIGVNGIENVPRYTLLQLTRSLDMRILPPVSEAPPRPIGTQAMPDENEVALPKLGDPIGRVFRRLRKRKEPSEKIRKTLTGKGAEPYRKRIREMEGLFTHRGGIAEGMRHTFLTHLFRQIKTATYMGLPGSKNTRNAEAHKLALTRIQEVNATQCSPPLQPAELAKCATKVCRYRNYMIARELGVTAKEVEAIGLETIVPKEIREAQDRLKEASQGHERERKRRLAEGVDAAIKAGLPNKDIVAMYHADGAYPGYVSSRKSRLKGLGELPRQGGGTGKGLFPTPPTC